MEYYSEYERQRLIDKMIGIAEKWFRVPYIYGGNSFAGVDCSGFVCNVLRSMGLIGQKSDYTVAGLWNKFSSDNNISLEAKDGSLVFWFKNGDAVHVGICIDDKTAIMAARGDKSLVPLGRLPQRERLNDVIIRANDKNAFVDYVPLNYRNDQARFVRLF